MRELRELDLQVRQWLLAPGKYRRIRLRSQASQFRLETRSDASFHDVVEALGRVYRTPAGMLAFLSISRQNLRSDQRSLEALTTHLCRQLGDFRDHDEILAEFKKMAEGRQAA